MTSPEHVPFGTENVATTSDQTIEAEPVHIVLDVTGTRPLRGRISGPAGAEQQFLGWIGLSGAVASYLDQPVEGS